MTIADRKEYIGDLVRKVQNDYNLFVDKPCADRVLGELDRLIEQTNCDVHLAFVLCNLLYINNINA